MITEDQRPPGLGLLVSRIAQTSSGLLRNRAELLSLEWQEERARLSAILLWTSAFVVLACSAAVILAGAILLAVPESWRVWVALGLAVMAGSGAFAAWKCLKTLMSLQAFPETLDQLKKDGLCLDTLKTRN